MKRNSTFIWNTYTFNNKSRDLVEVYFRRRPVAPFSKLSVTFQDQNPIFRSKYNVIRAGPSQQTEKESFCVVFPSSTKRQIRHYHVVVVQRRLKNVQKSVMHVQSCCFTNLNLVLFFPFSLPSPSSLLKHPNTNSISGLCKCQILRETRPLFYGRLQFVESPDVVTPTHVSDQHAESLDVIFQEKMCKVQCFFAKCCNFYLIRFEQWIFRFWWFIGAVKSIATG